MKRFLGTLALVSVLATPALATVYWSEDFGTPSGTTAVSAFDGWKNASTCEYLAESFKSDGTADTYQWDVRATAVSSGYTGASAGGNVYRSTYYVDETTYSYQEFTIKGIDLSSVAASKLSFGINTNSSKDGSALSVKYSTDNGSNWTDYAYQTSTMSGWRLAYSTADLPKVSGLWLKFVLNAATATDKVGNVQYRIDDVMIGDDATPAPDPVIENATIAQVVAADDNTKCTNVVGVITSIGGSNNRKQFTMQADNKALFVDNGNQNYAVGDEVKVLEGKKTTYASYGIVQFAPTDPVNGIELLTAGKGVPAPVDYTVEQFIAAPIADVQSLYVRIKDLKITGDLPANAGETNWIAETATAGNLNFTACDSADVSKTFTLRFPSDLGPGSLAIWQSKVRPVKDVDCFNAKGVVAAYSNANQLYLNSPAGSSAKFDGPIEEAGQAAVSDWSLF